MANIIWIFLKIFFLKEHDFRGTLFDFDIFWKLHFLNHFIFLYDVQFLMTFTQLNANLKSFLRGLLLVLGLKECQFFLCFFTLFFYFFSDEQLVLYGNFSVLGLLVLKHHGRRPKSTDFSVYKFIQARSS